MKSCHTNTITKQPEPQMASPARFAEQVFVLPFVLMTLAAISMIAFSAYTALDRSAAYMRNLQDQSRISLAFQSAEAEATYRLLTSVAVPGGLRIGGANDDLSSLVLGVESEGPTAFVADMWGANGELRRSGATQTPILVSYRDSGGLAAVNLLREEGLTALFGIAGFDPDDAAKLAAELADYIDPDKERRFQGAESGDYRLYQRRAPTDSPLRHITEMTRILSIPPELGDRFWNALTTITTLDKSSAIIKPAFTLPPLIGTLTESDVENSNNIVSQAFLNNPRPGQRARFLLTTDNQRGIYRMVEVEKTVNDLRKPFRRFFINAGPTAPTGQSPDTISSQDSSQQPSEPSGDIDRTTGQAPNDQNANDTEQTIPLIFTTNP